MNLAQIQRCIASAIKQDPYKDHIKSVSLFGSFLHGNTDPDSDVDLLFELDQTKPFGLFELIELQDRLSEKLGREVDLVEKDSLDKYIKNHVLAEAKLIYENQ